MPTTDPSDERAQLAWKPPSILLIDGDVSRRNERAASMRRLGLAVDCTDGPVGARALWQPEKYKLVLIELCGAAQEMNAFCTHLQELAPLQRIGIYRAKHPFIVSARHAPPVAMAGPSRLAGNGLRASHFTATGNGSTGLSRAALQIAALRPRTPRHVDTPESLAQETAAYVAARLLKDK